MKVNKIFNEDCFQTIKYIYIWPRKESSDGNYITTIQHGQKFYRL